MKHANTARWVFLISTCGAIGVCGTAAVFVPDSGTKATLVGVALGLLVALPSQIDGLELYGEKESTLDTKLTELYSPIHSMIRSVNSYLAKQSAAQTAIGTWIPLATIPNFNDLTKVFQKHAHDLGNHSLDMWMDIERETLLQFVNKGCGFTYTQERKEWFEKLENDYQTNLGKVKK